MLPHACTKAQKAFAGKEGRMKAASVLQRTWSRTKSIVQINRRFTQLRADGNQKALHEMACKVIQNAWKSSQRRWAASHKYAARALMLAEEAFDRKCDALPWKNCTKGVSMCCGSYECELVNPGSGSKERLCQPK